ncbi:MAG TPA: adenylate/guanylate cyclase domain-containing protein [Stellaceae bacterium]|nr:adenylate/guanylate cyclase domain-containing protein [Stellaceae bacterium]
MPWRLSWLRGLREAGLAFGVAASIILPLSSLDIGPLRILETASLDLRFRLRGPKPPGDDVAVVLVDDPSLAALGRWPLNRHLFAEAVRRIRRAGAKVIVFDLLFAEPEQPLPQDLRDSARTAAARLADGQDPALRAALDRLAGDDPDGDLAAAISDGGNVLLPFAFSFAGASETRPPAYLSDQAYQQFDKSPSEPVFPLQPKSAVTPVAPLGEAAAGLGHVDISYDRDGAPRYDYLALPFDGDFLPSLPVRAAAAYFGVPWNDVGLALGAGVRIGRHAVPTDRAMRLVVNYRGPRGTIPTYSFVDLLQGRVPADRLAGRIVLIGASFIGIADTNPAPFDNTPMPGTERMANIIDSLIAGDFIGENPPPWPLIVIAVVLLLAVSSGAAIAVTPTRIAVVVAAAPLVLWAFGAQLAFDRGLWLPLVNPMIALAAASLGVLSFRYGFVDAQRRRVHAAFRHYLAPDLVNRLAANAQQLRLGGETRTISVMFSDIRGFTSISESFKANPEGLSRLINRGFLSPMTKLIMARRGTIDKYMGDCIMAFWNAPLDDAHHADRACASALAMLGELDRINGELEREAKAEGRAHLPLHIGVGINTGACVVGNMGSDERFAYTAMGDAVNLASRLEGQTKTYHAGIIIGEATRAAAPSWAALELDLIAVKGKAEAVRIYALLGDAALAGSPAFTALAERHAAMLAAYRSQDWRGARAALAECRGCDVGLAGFYDLYAERIAYFETNPPGPEWDGVFTAETK